MRIKNYTPYHNARKAFECREDEVMLHGGVNTGKTLCNFYKAHMFALKYDGVRILFVRKALSDLLASALETYEGVILPCGIDDPQCPVVLKKRRDLHWYAYPNGSRIFLGGMNRRGKTLSSEYDMVVTVQTEEFTEEDWEYFLTRIGRGAGANAPYAQVIGDANPHGLGKMHWIPRRKSLVRFKLFREYNPALRNQKTGKLTDLGKDTERRLARLTGTTRRRLRDGEWIGSESLVYPEFSEDVHIIDREDFGNLDIRFEKFYLGMDWGYTDPASLSLYGLTFGTETYPEPRLIQLRQTYRTGELMAFWKRRALAYQRWVRIYGHGASIDKMICDKSKPEFIEEMRQAGLPAVATDGTAGSILENINAVRTRLVERSLYFVRNNTDGVDEILEASFACTRTTEEMFRYEFPELKQGATRRDVNPVDNHNHGMDELGYVCRELHIPVVIHTTIETMSTEVFVRRFVNEEPGAGNPKATRWKRYA